MIIYYFCYLYFINCKGFDLLEMFIGDDSTKIWALLWIFAVPFFQNLLCLRNQLILNFFCAQYVVRSYASLPDVNEFAPQKSFGRYLHVCCTVDIDWTEKLLLQKYYLKWY